MCCMLERHLGEKCITHRLTQVAGRVSEFAGGVVARRIRRGPGSRPGYFPFLVMGVMRNSINEGLVRERVL